MGLGDPLALASPGLCRCAGPTSAINTGQRGPFPGPGRGFSDEDGSGKTQSIGSMRVGAGSASANLCKSDKAREGNQGPFQTRPFSVSFFRLFSFSDDKKLH